MIPPKWLLAAVLAGPAAAAHIAPMANITADEAKYEMTLQVATDSDIMTLAFAIVPLTEAVGLDQTETTRDSISIYGNMIAVTQSNYNGINSTDDIAYLSCDSLNNSFVTPDTMLTSLMEQAPGAILLYSQTGNCCSLNATDLPYQSIFTMISTADAAQTLNLTQTDAQNGVRSAITGSASSDNDDTTTPDNGNGSAIAMSVLYSITGLITVLFLAIIAMGAARAHRYPERYGPRSGYGGQPRQSRARGIARAVLETLPIVKFGDNSAAGPGPLKPDPNIELESRTSAAEDGAHSLAPPDVQAPHLSAIPEDAEAHSKSAATAATVAAGTTAAAAIASAATADDKPDGVADVTVARVEDDNPGCSICTEDFTVGEDVRVLPCNHKFHPTCVDPWLVNVSGTCPLCRLDLHPHDEQESQSEEEWNLPPPLDGDEAATPAPADRHHRRASRFFDLNRLRHASVEERIEVLRRYRTEAQSQRHGASSSPSSGEDEHGSSARLTRRLRDRFRVLTHSQASSDDPSRSV